MRITQLMIGAITGVLAMSLPGDARAQSAAPGDSACTYEACALRIEGWRLVRGAAAEVVAKPGFFRPLQLAPFVTGDSATAYARRYQQAANRSAWLANGGFVAMVAGLALAHLRDDTCDRNEVGICPDGDALQVTAAGLVLGGTLAAVVSIPIAFRADRHRSRAVWWNNARFGR